MNHHRPITALVVAQDEFFRVGLRLLLRNMTAVGHVMEAAGADEAVRLVRSTPYDVAVVDASYARGESPFETIRALGATLPGAPLVLYADNAAELSDYCLRGDITCAVSPRGPNSATQLCSAVRRLISTRAKGASVVSPAPPRHAAGDAAAPLTTKERQVLTLVTSGQSSKAIARSMQVSLRTVESHRARICAKLGVRTVPELTKFALRAGLTSMDDG